MLMQGGPVLDARCRVRAVPHGRRAIARCPVFGAMPVGRWLPNSNPQLRYPWRQNYAEFLNFRVSMKNIMTRDARNYDASF